MAVHPARETNPRGFFEDVIINRINEQILEPYDYCKIHKEYPVFPKPHSPYCPRRGHHWLAYIEPGTIIQCHDETVIDQIKKAIANKQPFAYKDPRFNYTLPVWLPHLPEDTRYICMFRNPASVVRSVIKECHAVEYLKDFHIDEELAYRIWFNFYRHLLDSLSPELLPKMIFVDYEELVAGKCTDHIAAFLDTVLTVDFIEPSLNRSKSEDSFPGYVRELYMELSAYL